MRIAARALACLALLFPVVVGSAVASGAGVGGQEKQAVIVQLGDPRALAAVVAEERSRGGRVEHVYSRVFPGFAAELAPGRIASLAADPRLRSVVPDEVTKAAGQQLAVGSRPDGSAELRLDSLYSYGATGSGVAVYIIDSAIRFSHQEFGARARSGYDFVDGDADASDCKGHGTHVAGTIGGATYRVAKRRLTLSPGGCGDAKAAAGCPTWSPRSTGSSDRAPVPRSSTSAAAGLLGDG